MIRAAIKIDDLFYPAKVNLAKLLALDKVENPAAGKYDRKEATKLMTEARRDFDHATVNAGRAAAVATTAKSQWQSLDKDQMCRQVGTTD